MKSKIFLILGLALALLAFGGSAAYGAGEQDAAVAYLCEQGIYTGDDNGDLLLDKSLTRAELAAILTRLDFMTAPYEWEEWGEARFRDEEHRYNTFTDLPHWALPYVEYCYQLGYMKGLSAEAFGPQTTVNPQMACTVMLRYCRVEETDWDYANSVSKAQALGLAPGEGLEGDTIRRDTVAQIIYRSIQYAEQSAQEQSAQEQSAQEQSAQEQSAQEQSAQEQSAEAIDLQALAGQIRQEFYLLVNEHRESNGLRKLEANSELQEYADLRATELRLTFGHTRPDGTAAGSGWHNSQNYMNTRYAENVISVCWFEADAEAKAIAEYMFAAWKGSQGHNRHMLYDFKSEITMTMGLDLKMESGRLTTPGVWATGY